MADILISKFTTQIPRVGATPATPGFAESEGQDPIAPSGTPQVYTPVTIGSPANGLSISGTQVLTIGLASTSTTGALSSTDWNTFNNKINLTSPITGYTVGANTALADTDTILQAFGKVQGQINARISGTIASGQVAFGTGVNTVGGENTLWWDSTNDRLGIGTSTPISKLEIIHSSTANAFTVINTTALGVSSGGGAAVRSNTHPTTTGQRVGGFLFGSVQSAVEYSPIGIFGYSAGLWDNTSRPGYFAFETTPSGSNTRQERLRITESGQVWINTTSGTNTLDVNGTARIRTISNLGTAATSVFVPSATGVVSFRTLAELASDMSSVLFTSQTLTASQKNQVRVNIGSTSATPQVIATAGAMNDLAVTSNHLVFTGASVVLSGIVAGLDGEEITILNASGTNLELISQSSLSTASNRFASGVIVPNLSIVRLKYRTTTARWVLENVGINDGRYVRKDINDDKLGNLRFLNASSLPIVRITPNGSEFANVFETVQIDGTVSLAFNRQGQIIQNAQASGSSYVSMSLSWLSTLYFQFRNNLPDSGETNLLSANFINRAVFQRSANSLQRSQGVNGFTRRDELYLNYSQTVATTGTINNLAINADCKLLILTGADDLTGVVPVDNTRLLRIEARGGNRIIRDQSASSTDVNRFALGADLTINAGEVYQFIYTDSRWRRVL